MIIEDRLREIEADYQGDPAIHELTAEVRQLKGFAASNGRFIGELQDELERLRAELAAMEENHGPGKCGEWDPVPG